VADHRGVDLSSGPQTIHVIGAGGSGMSAIATVLALMGHDVSGSDLRSSVALDRLAAAGMIVQVGHDAALARRSDVVAMSTAIPADNPEVLAARAAGVEVLSRAGILAAMAATRQVAAVAGTHGKTTTSAMLTRILAEAGWRPSWVVGGDIVGLGGGGGWDAEGTWMVVEADESDGTFLVLPRHVGLVTSVEPDHLDFYGDEASMLRAYESFLAGCGGARVVCADDPGAAALGRGPAGGPGVITYGTTVGSTFTMSDLEAGRSGMVFEVRGPDGDHGRVQLAVPGIHNARNATGALAAAVAIGVPLAEAAAGLGRFTGVARRLERCGERDGITFIDDYAHLPSEVATVLATLAGAGWARVVAVFQPHRYSRTSALHGVFADAFVDADVVVVTGIYPSGEAPIPGVSGRLVADAIAAAHGHTDLHYCEDLADLPSLLAGLLVAGDLCVTLAAGDLTDLPRRLAAGP